MSAGAFRLGTTMPLKSPPAEKCLPIDAQQEQFVKGDEKWQLRI
jgi:hypothetical protein